jgi:hypothetical protein
VLRARIEEEIMRRQEARRYAHPMLRDTEEVAGVRGGQRKLLSPYAMQVAQGLAQALHTQTQYTV